MERILELLKENHWIAEKVDEGIKIGRYVYGGEQVDFGTVPCKTEEEFLQLFEFAADTFDIDEYVNLMFKRVDKGEFESITQRLFVDACSLQNAFKSTLVCLRERDFKRTVEITIEKVQRFSKEYEVTYEQLEGLKVGINPFEDELDSLIERGNCTYDYAVCDMDGETLVDWK